MNANNSSKFSKLLSRSLIATIVGLAAMNASAVVDLGDASVLSQQGQRLKVAVVYGSGPSERVPVTRFSIADVRVEGSTVPPKPEQFTISAPAKRNIVYLQSKEIVTADKVQLVMTAADTPDKKVVYDLIVPPAKSAPSVMEQTSAKKMQASKKRSKTKMRRAKQKQ
jgi:hypothetical protein